MKRLLSLLLLSLGCTASAIAQTAPVTATVTPSVTSYNTAGGSVTFSVTIEYSAALGSLSLQFGAPNDSWTYASMSAANIDHVPGIRPKAGDKPDAQGSFGFSYSDIPVSPITFSFTLNNASGLSTDQVFTPKIAYSVQSGTGGTQTITLPSITLPPIPVAPSISVDVQDATIAYPTGASFSVTASGIPAPTYKWQYQLSGTTGFVDLIGGAFSGVTTPTLTVSGPLAPNNTGTLFRCIVTNAGGTVTSRSAVLTVQYAPEITVQPVSRGVTLGQSTTFAVTAGGNPAPSYQWTKNGAPITGATSASYSINSVQSADEASYAVVVSNSLGEVTSDAATLTVNTPPVFTTQPADVTVTSGGTATFSAVASGKPVPAYQWSRNGVALSGQTNADLVLANVARADAGAYTVTAGNSVAVITSNSANLTVNFEPVISSHPVDRSVGLGTVATFNIVFAASPSPIIQWQVQLPNTTSWSNLSETGPYSGVTTPMLAVIVVANGATLNGAKFRCVLSNGIGAAVASNPATLTLQYPASVVTPPANQSGVVNGSATFTVAADGNPSPTFQWQRKPANGSAFANIADGATYSGSKTSALTITSLALAMDGDQFQCVVSNGVGSAVISGAATLSVSQQPAAPSVTTQPISITRNAGQSATFNVVMAGYPTPTYKWRKGTADLTDGGNVSGSGTPTLTITNVQPADEASYSVYASNSEGNTTSSAATLTVNTPPVFTTQPQSATVLEGASVTLSADATGKPAPAYQWQKGTTDVAGATGSTLTIPNIQRSAAGSYRVLASNSVATGVASDLVTVDVQFPAEISAQPANTTVNAGGTATLTVTVAANPTATYQWKKNGTDIPGKTTASLAIANAQPADEGSYTVVVANGLGTPATSTAASLTVNTPPGFTTHPTSTSANQGASASFSVEVTGKPAPALQWKKVNGSTAVTLTDGTKYSGATTATLTINNVQPATDNGSYFAVATNSVTSASSNPATLTVNTGPAITTQPTAAASYLVGANVTLSITATAVPAPTYQWRKGGTAINGATNASLSFTSIQLADAGSYDVVVTNSVSSVTSGPVAFVVYQPPSITTQPSAQTIIAGQNASFTVVATGDPAPTYQWRRNGFNVAGATSSTLTLNNVAYDAGGTVTVVVTNAGGVVTSTPVALTVKPVAPSITGPLTATGIAGRNFLYQINAATTSATYNAIGLPPGLTIDTATGAIIGVPAAAGTSSVTISAHNVTGDDSKTLTLVINVPPPVITSAASSTARVGTAFNFPVIATNSPTGYTATGLPPGLSINATTGVISGTPTQGGTFNATLTASNGTGSITTQFVVTVDAPTLPAFSGNTKLSGVQGVAFNFTPIFSNGPITAFAATGLPPGLSISTSTGAITGTPTVSGSYTVTLTATNSGGSTQVPFTVTINPAPAAPVITSASSAAATAGTLFTFQLTSTGTPAATSYAVAGLPALGLAVNGSAGLIAGTPTGAGTLTLKVNATNSVGTGPTAALVITVNPNASAPVMTNAPVVAGRVGEALTFSLSGTNSPTHYALTSGALPGGLTIDGSTGAISGSPTQAGRFDVVVAGSNASGQGLGMILSFNILPALTTPVITSNSTAAAQVGQPFQYVITATNAPTAFNATGLPGWATLNQSTGIISGLPNEAPNEPISITLSAANGDGSGAPKVLRVTVTPAPLTPKITSSLTAGARVGSAFTYTVTASEAPTSFMALDLPAGLSLAPTTGIISGTPSVSGTFSVTLRGANTAGLGGPATLVLRIAPPPEAPAITSAAAAHGKVGAAFLYSATAAPGTITGFTLGGTLPLGLSFNTSTGVLSGNPTEAGVFALQLTATADGGSSMPQPLVVSIAAADAAPIITSPNVAIGTVGVDFSYQITAAATPAFPAAPFAPPFLLDAVNLPSGLAVNPSSGLIQGKPTTVGRFTATLIGTNSAGTGAGRDVVITIAPAPSAPVVTSQTAAAAQAGVAFSYQIAASNQATSFEAIGAPSWMTINSQTGLIAGTPAQPGVVKVQLIASNAAGASNPVELTLTIAPAATAPIITSSRTASGRVGGTFAYQIAASRSPTQYVVTGLPSGLSLDSTTGIISGTPTVSGRFEVELVAVNAAGASAPVTLAVTISPNLQLVVPGA